MSAPLEALALPSEIAPKMALSDIRIKFVILSGEPIRLIGSPRRIRMPLPQIEPSRDSSIKLVCVLIERP
jgi:hypothetical protein